MTKKFFSSKFKLNSSYYHNPKPNDSIDDWDFKKFKAYYLKIDKKKNELKGLMKFLDKDIALI